MSPPCPEKLYPNGWEPLRHFMLRTALLSYDAVYRTGSNAVQAGSVISNEELRRAAEAHDVPAPAC